MANLTCKPGVKEPESLGATPHKFSVQKVLFYVDPHNEIARSPQCTALTVRRIVFAPMIRLTQDR